MTLRQLRFFFRTPISGDPVRPFAKLHETYWTVLPITIYLQFFAFWAAYRPSIQKLWALGLIGFHAASYLMMSIDFASNCLLLALFFLVLPSNVPSWKSILLELPLFGHWMRPLFLHRRQARFYGST